LTVTGPRLSGSRTRVIVRLGEAATTGAATAEAAVDAVAPSPFASLCTVSITCCIGDKVGLGASCVSTVTDLMIGSNAAFTSGSAFDAAEAAESLSTAFACERSGVAKIGSGLLVASNAGWAFPPDAGTAVPVGTGGAVATPAFAVEVALEFACAVTAGSKANKLPGSDGVAPAVATGPLAASPA
jgi:hypothetical protein